MGGIMVDQDIRYQRVYDKFHPKILQYLIRITGSQKDADNLTEKVFREVNKSLYTFKGKSSLPTWIYRIATNAALDKMRRLSFKKGQQKTQSDELKPEQIKDGNFRSRGKGPAPDDNAIQTEVNSCIRKIMEEIPGTYKIALVLSELEGLKNREIGNVLDLNPDTVTFRLHRTREKIRKKLKARFELLGTDINGYTYDLKSVFGDPKE
jgi:RNA polymerase sigma-70 factor (ECF subfamily)